jgi:YggT family protein
MRAILDLIVIALNFYWYIVIGSAILSWLIAFNVVNVRNQFVGAVADFLYKMTEPVLAPIRRRMPAVSGLDLSPIVLLFGIIFIQLVIGYYIRPYVF